MQGSQERLQETGKRAMYLRLFSRACAVVCTCFSITHSLCVRKKTRTTKASRKAQPPTPDGFSIEGPALCMFNRYMEGRSSGRAVQNETNADGKELELRSNAECSILHRCLEGHRIKSMLMRARTLLVATAGHGCTDKEGQPPRRKGNSSLKKENMPKNKEGRPDSKA